MDFILGLMVWLGMALIVFLVGAIIYRAIYPPKQIILTASEWVCTKEESRTVYYPVMLNGIINQMPNTERVCMEYKRVK